MMREPYGVHRPPLAFNIAAAERRDALTEALHDAEKRIAELQARVSELEMVAELRADERAVVRAAERWADSLKGGGDWELAKAVRRLRGEDPR